MFTRTTWTHYDQSHLLTGGGLTGVGVEIDRHLDGLRGEAETRRLAGASAGGGRIGFGLTNLSATIHWRATRSPVKSATRAG